MSISSTIISSSFFSSYRCEGYFFLRATGDLFLKVAVVAELGSCGEMIAENKFI